MKSFDPHELEVLAAGAACDVPFPRSLHPACERLMARGVLSPRLCEHGHYHLEPGPMHALAIMCHRYATEQVEVGQ